MLSRTKGVIVGDDVFKLFRYAREKNFAIPAIVRRHDARPIPILMAEADHGG